MVRVACFSCLINRDAVVKSAETMAWLSGVRDAYDAQSWVNRIPKFITCMNDKGFTLFDITDLCYMRGQLSQVDLVFINKKTNFHNILSNKEVVYYSNDKDLIKKIKYYSQHDPKVTLGAGNRTRYLRVLTSVCQTTTSFADTDNSVF